MDLLRDMMPRSWPSPACRCPQVWMAGCWRRFSPPRGRPAMRRSWKPSRGNSNRRCGCAPSSARRPGRSRPGGDVQQSRAGAGGRRKAGRGGDELPQGSRGEPRGSPRHREPRGGAPQAGADRGGRAFLEKAHQAEPPATCERPSTWGCSSSAGADSPRRKCSSGSWVEKEPGNLAARVNLGHTYYRTGHRDEAEAMFRGALAEDPGLANARFGLGDRGRQRGNQECLARIPADAGTGPRACQRRGRSSRAGRLEGPWAPLRGAREPRVFRWRPILGALPPPLSSGPLLGLQGAPRFVHPHPCRAPVPRRRPGGAAPGPCGTVFRRASAIERTC